MFSINLWSARLLKRIEFRNTILGFWIKIVDISLHEIGFCTEIEFGTTRRNEGLNFGIVLIWNTLWFSNWWNLPLTGETFHLDQNLKEIKFHLLKIYTPSWFRFLLLMSLILRPKDFRGCDAEINSIWMKLKAVRVHCRLSSQRRMRW